MNVPTATETPRMPQAPRHAPPAGACDSHAHVFGPYARFPLAHAPSYAPPLAPAALHRGMLDILGAARGVLVQPAPYGHDASALLDALVQSGGRLRGVAVADATASEAQLRALFDGGVRGLRFVEMRAPDGTPYAGSVGIDQLLAMAPALRRVGLHAQLWAPVDDYPRLLPQLRAAGVAVVLDHMACLKPERGLADPAFQAVLAALRAGDAWVKLTLCRVSQQAPAYPDLRPFHDALLQANPARLLWGSDWPYVRMGERSPDAGALLDLFHDWVPDAALRRRILVDNPAALYGFPATEEPA
ncbi:amidohydrolase [uncultured Massilia sp.]|uniref:amidohydrolase family protein n=1 Tax=uncultured Massilia sp. TaxID=169973 RepID=UPI0025FA3515|nr:amidohydrolase family protein [uncultured Massilia sp.]